MQHNHRVLRNGGELLFQFLKQHFIEEGVAVPVFRVAVLHQIDIRHTVAHAFAAAIVVEPEHVVTRFLHHVQQIFTPVGIIDIEFLARQVGKHAGKGKRRGGSARRHVREVHNVLPRQFWVGFAFVAVQGKVHRPRRLADHEDDHGEIGVFVGNVIRIVVDSDEGQVLPRLFP